MKKVFHELSKPANASYVVKEEIAAQFAAPFHFHKGYELTYIVKGHGKFYGGDRILNFTGGELYLFGIGFPHYFVNDKSFIASGELAHSITIQFGDDFLDGYGQPEFSKLKTLLKNACRGIKITGLDAQLQQKILAAPQSAGLQGLVNLLGILDLIASANDDGKMTISTDVFENTLITQKREQKLNDVYRYVLENFKEPITNPHAASLACMNESAFCRYFKRRTNKTLSQFVSHVRVAHAMQLLAEEDMSIAEVCFECGFTNLSYFNRQFKAVTGKTPFIYRKNFY